ncbi:MAG: VWA domain-containing protein [Chromatiaceae bacterium]|nr:VWA domain-containing protein [Chromatiaceae bacterium]
MWRRLAGPGVIGRILTLALLLLAAWNPSLPAGRAAQHLVVLIDQSASMQRDWLDSAWRPLRDALADLPDDSRVSLVRFAADRQIEWQGDPAMTLPEQLPQSRALDMTATDLWDALRTAAALRDPSRANAILLLSDGRDNGPQAGQPSLAAATGQPLLWWRPAQRADGGASIQALRAPLSIAAGQPLTLLAELAGSGQAQARLLVRTDGRVVADAAVGSTALPITLPNPGAGLHRIEVSLVQGDRVLDRRVTSVQVEGAARVLVIAAAGQDTPLTASLRAGGWPVTAITPEQAASDRFGSADAVILDDIAVADLPAGVWEALAQRVRSRGLGLLVLGGPHSFTAGAYRHSVLEGLLPVTAESPEPLDPAAVLFLVDRSGSMGRPNADRQPTRLELALRAVIETARALRPGDRAGLITFAMQPQERVALSAQRDAVSAFEQQAGLSAQGGTRLAPALRRGVELLGASEIATRLLVVVTDGVLDEPDELLRAAIGGSARDVRIIVLAVGAGAQTGALQRLAEAGAGEVLRVTQVASLPRLMQQHVEQLRAPVVSGPVRPSLQTPLPMFTTQPAEWPVLDAYALAKPRPDASLYLAAPNGDPLLAGWHAGTGRVVALPGGLGGWARAWQHWQHWGALAGGLAEWVAGARAANLYLQGQQDGAALAFTLHAVDDAGEWLNSAPAVTLSGPDGAPVGLEVTAEAPGLYRLRPMHRAAGRHDLDVRLGDYSRHLAYIYEPASETSAGTPPAPYLDAGLVNGAVDLWQPGQGFPGPAGHTSARGVLLGLALLTFVATLVGERGLHRRALQGLETGRSKLRGRKA